jgi:hypothetical protein
VAGVLSCPLWRPREAFVERRGSGTNYRSAHLRFQLVWVLVVLGHGRRIKSAVLTTIEAGDSVDLEGQNTAFTTLAIAMVSPQLVAISTA